MKKYLPPFEAILCFVFAATILAFARAQMPSPPVAKNNAEFVVQTHAVHQLYFPEQHAAVDPKSIFITEGTNQAFLIQTYNRILIGTWFEMRNDEVKAGTSIMVADYPVFAPEKVRVIVKTEPTVTRKNDGTWEISFKEVRP